MQKIIPLLLTLLICCLAAGCQADEANPSDPTADSLQAAVIIPEMVTTDVSMLVSDSGVIRYHAISPIWYRYNMGVKDPYWHFPDGIELHQLDNDMQPIGQLRADTAYHFERRELWHLIGNVNIENVRGERFQTQDLYWDMRQQTVYSDSFIHIERQRDILEGYGFTSDQSFSKYEVRKTTGIFALRAEGEQADFEGDAPDDGEHLAENDEPGTESPAEDTYYEESRPLTPQEKAEAARNRRNRHGQPDNFNFDR